MLTIIVYNPNYIHPHEVVRLLEELEKHGIEATTVTHLNNQAKPLYIEKTK